MKLKPSNSQTAILILALALSALCATQPLRAQETNNPAITPSPEELAARVAAAAQLFASTNAAFNSPTEHVVRSAPLPVARPRLPPAGSRTSAGDSPRSTRCSKRLWSAR